jgi:hypothetical protein
MKWLNRNSLRIDGQKLVHDGTSNKNAWQDGRLGKSESPRASIGQNEACQERSQKIDDESNFFGDALLNQV